MKPKIIYSTKFLKRISLFMNIAGISLFPIVILRDEFKGTNRGKILINHETIHFKQQLELLVIPFYILYIIFYIWNIFKYLRPSEAYKNIPFEKEAKQNETNMNYLKTRKLYAWIR